MVTCGDADRRHPSPNLNPLSLFPPSLYITPLISLSLSFSLSLPPGTVGTVGASLDSDPLLWEGFKVDQVAVGFHGQG